MKLIGGNYKFTLSGYSFFAKLDLLPRIVNTAQIKLTVSIRRM